MIIMLRKAVQAAEMVEDALVDYCFHGPPLHVIQLCMWFSPPLIHLQVLSQRSDGVMYLKRTSRCLELFYVVISME